LDPYSSYHTTTYDPTRYINADVQYSFDHYETIAHPALPIPPASGFSELGNALVESSTSEPQSTSRSTISLPSLPLPSQPPPKHEPSEGVSSSLLTGDYSPCMKEEGQEPLHVGTSSMPRSSTPLHGHSSLRHRPHPCDSFRQLVQDPAAFPGFAPPTKVRSCLTIL
jgi:hypothetical protein